jgi:hypothetical protein
MGRTGHSALIIGISASAVFGAGIAVTLTRGDGPVARAETTLGPVRDASVVSANGLSLAAHAGTLLASGDVVSTGPTGNAQLLTRGRITMLASNAVLAVRDGAHQQLRTGTAVIDAQEGPTLTLAIAGDTLVVPSGSATEADRAAAVRIGSLAGPAGVTNGSGRHLSLAPLWQATINGDALPGAPTPLQLSDVKSVRDAEARAVPQLVADNLAMEALARGINSTGNSTAHVVEAGWSGTLVSRGVGVSRSDQVLPVVIADATTPAGGSAQERYDRVVGWRAEGGSWGVVIHLLSARAAQIADTLHSLQQTEKTGTVGKISANKLGVSPLGPVLPINGQKPPGAHGSPSSTPPTEPTITPPSTGGGKTPTPKPTQSPNLLGGLVGTVGTVLKDLLGLLPSDSASAKTNTTQQQTQLSSTVAPATAATPTPTATPSPTPSPTSSGLLDDVLGGVVGGLSGQ